MSNPHTDYLSNFIAQATLFTEKELDTLKQIQFYIKYLYPRKRYNYGPLCGTDEVFGHKNRIR